MSSKTKNPLEITNQEMDAYIILLVRHARRMDMGDLARLFQNRFSFRLRRVHNYGSIEADNKLHEYCMGRLTLLQFQNQIVITTGSGGIKTLTLGVAAMSILGHLVNEKEGFAEDTEETWISFWLSGFSTKAIPGQNPQANLRRIIKEGLDTVSLVMKRTPTEKMPGSLTVLTTDGMVLGWVPRKIHRVIGHRFDRIEGGRILDVGPAWPDSPHQKPHVLFSYTNNPKIDYFRNRALGVVK